MPAPRGASVLPSRDAPTSSGGASATVAKVPAGRDAREEQMRRQRTAKLIPPESCCPAADPDRENLGRTHSIKYRRSFPAFSSSFRAWRRGGRDSAGEGSTAMNHCHLSTPSASAHSRRSAWRTLSSAAGRFQKAFLKTSVASVLVVVGGGSAGEVADVQPLSGHMAVKRTFIRTIAGDVDGGRFYPAGGWRELQGETGVATCRQI